MQEKLDYALKEKIELNNKFDNCKEISDKKENLIKELYQKVNDQKILLTNSKENLDQCLSKIKDKDNIINEKQNLNNLAVMEKEKFISDLNSKDDRISFLNKEISQLTMSLQEKISLYKNSQSLLYTKDSSNDKLKNINSDLLEKINALKDENDKVNTINKKSYEIEKENRNLENK